MPCLFAKLPLSRTQMFSFSGRSFLGIKPPVNTECLSLPVAKILVFAQVRVFFVFFYLLFSHILKSHIFN